MAARKRWEIACLCEKAGPLALRSDDSASNVKIGDLNQNNV